MTKFSYQAINESGSVISGVIEAESADMANSMLSARGYIPSQLTEKGPISTSAMNWQNIKKALSPIKPPDLILFTKQLKTLIQAGIPILRLLQVLENQTENLNLKSIIVTMARDIKEGSSLYDAFKKHPKAFSPLYCSMIHAGESSGALPEILDRLIYIIEHEHKIRSDIKAALQYPLIVVVFLVIAFFVLLTFVIPKFVVIFRSAGLDLPLPTQICMFLYNFLANNWYLLLAAIVVAIVSAVFYLRTDQGKYTRDVMLMHIPVVGPLFIKAAMSRFSSIFSILQSSGVAILDAMKILTTTIGNAAIAREFDLINERLEEGQGIAGPLKSAKYFTPIVINMVAIGEESGNLEEMLSEIAIHYDSELEYAMKKLSDAVGPLLTVGLAAVVGFFALAIFLPMWDLTKMVR